MKYPEKLSFANEVIGKPLSDKNSFRFVYFQCKGTVNVYTNFSVRNYVLEMLAGGGGGGGLSQYVSQCDGRNTNIDRDHSSTGDPDQSTGYSFFKIIRRFSVKFAFMTL